MSSRRNPGQLFNACLVVATLSVAANAQDTTSPPTPERELGPANAITLEYEYEDFDDDLEAWHIATAEYSHKFPSFGSAVGRVYYGKRFGDTGTQYELELYPRLGRKTYAYVETAVSSDNIFADRRYGLQLYHTLPHSWEVSAGGRRLEFDPNHVTLYTGSIGKYSGNWYAVVQPYFADRDQGTSSTVTFLLRRYGATGDDYSGLRGTYGEVPEQDILLNETLDLRSWSARIERSRRFTSHFILRGFLGYRSQELRFDRDRNSYVVGIGLKNRY